MQTEDVQLGRTYRDTITGFEGVATAKVEYLHGTTKFLVEGPGDVHNKIRDGYFDAERLRESTRQIDLETGVEPIGLGEVSSLQSGTGIPAGARSGY